MYVWGYACMYMYVCRCVCMRMYACMWVCMYVGMYMYVCVYLGRLNYVFGPFNMYLCTYISISKGFMRQYAMPEF